MATCSCGIAGVYISRFLKNSLKNRRMTYEQFAEVVGCDPRTVARWCSGQIHSIDAVVKIAAGLHVNVGDIFSELDDVPYDVYSRRALPVFFLYHDIPCHGKLPADGVSYQTCRTGKKCSLIAARGNSAADPRNESVRGTSPQHRTQGKQDGSEVTAMKWFAIKCVAAALLRAAAKIVEGL